MDKQTPIQIASELTNEIIRIEIRIKEFQSKLLFDGEWEGCCRILEGLKSKILAYRTAWENEIEYNRELLLIWNRDLEVKTMNRISKLTSALKILNSEKIE